MGGRHEARIMASSEPSNRNVEALHRFGFGPKGGSIERIASDPRSALIAKLDRKGAGLAGAPHLMSSSAARRAVLEFNAERQARERLERRKREQQEHGGGPQGMQPAMQPALPPAPAPAANQAKPAPPPPPLPQRIFLDEAKDRIDAASAAESGFFEA